MATFKVNFYRTVYTAIDPCAPSNSQSGRTVLITGSTLGIGFATAKAFVIAQANSVIVTGRREDVLRDAVNRLESLAVEIAKSNPSKVGTATRIIGYACDISNEDSLNNLWSFLRDKDIAVNVLILNAAIVGSITAAGNAQTMASLWPVFEMNVLSSFRMTDRFLAQAEDPKAGKGKVLINLSTARAHNSPQRSNEGYGPSKIAITKSMEALADHTPSSTCLIINIMPGMVASAAATRSTGTGSGMAEPWIFDDAMLPASTIVALASRARSPATPSKAESENGGPEPEEQDDHAGQPDFAYGHLHGRFIWANWDLTSLSTPDIRQRLQNDPTFLRLGLNGLDAIGMEQLGSPMGYLGYLKARWQREVETEAQQGREGERR